MTRLRGGDCGSLHGVLERFCIFSGELVVMVVEFVVEGGIWLSMAYVADEMVGVDMWGLHIGLARDLRLHHIFLRA